MNRIVYLEGSRAVGKTTLLKLIKKNNPNFIIIDGFARKEFSFDMTNINEFIINEKLYLACDIIQFKLLKELDTTIIIVKGPYTDAYYARNFAKHQFPKLNLEDTELAPYLHEAECCSPFCIVYLDADKETILKRCENDNHIRSTMNDFMNNWLDDFSIFYKSKKETIVIDTINLNSESVYNAFMDILTNYNGDCEK